jgi:hypothetical protein
LSASAKQRLQLDMPGFSTGHHQPFNLTVRVIVTNNWIYDIETFPNVFTVSFEHADAPLNLQFEISPWVNQSREIVEFANWIADNRGRLVGFNNVEFDYPVFHTLLKMGVSDANTLYQKAMAIIGTQDGAERWSHQVYENHRVVPQVDLFKIHHFDNRARSTSLKVLEFNMRSDSIEDLPFPVGTELTKEQAVVLKQYNAHDVSETKKFLKHTLPMIKFREELVTKYPGRDWINFNDTKIGKEYFIMELEKAGIECYEFGKDGRQPKQTKRPIINLNDAILPEIQFANPELQRVLYWLRGQSITETKGVFTDLTARVYGFEFVFGTGGIHGSVEKKIIESDDEWVIVDLDVASYYPNLAIESNFYPEHLGVGFCRIYRNLYNQRKGFAKGTAENAMLKLALNGVYGDSNNPFSVFYDPLFTMQITLNGQLLLCMLAELIWEYVYEVEMIQVNTDGLTVRIRRTEIEELRKATTRWQSFTGLTLEENIYKSMFIRDVNNYIAVYEDGKVKRKGAYEYDMEWHQNHSALVVAKVAEQFLVYGKPIRETIENWPDLYDFMLRTKVPRSSHLVIEHEDQQVKIQNTCRYYIAKDGGRLFKWMPPLKGKQEWRRIGVESGWGVQVCNRIEDAGKLPVDFDYYVREVEKLVIGLE